MNSMKPTLSELRKKISVLFDEMALGNIQKITNDDFDDLRYILSGISGNCEYKLYRYSKADVWNICNLSSQQLRLSPVGNMNDIYEGVPRGEVSKTSAHDWDIAKEMAYLSCLTEEGCNPTMWAHYADAYKGICVEYDLCYLEDNHPAFMNLYPICYTNERHIQIDMHELCTELGLYKQACIHRADYDGDLNILNDMVPLFLTKGTEWAYEEEWRIIVPAHYTLDCGVQKTIFDDLNVPFDCITAVCFGPP